MPVAILFLYVLECVLNVFEQKRTGGRRMPNNQFIIGVERGSSMTKARRQRSPVGGKIAQTSRKTRLHELSDKLDRADRDVVPG
jgi:hypothetical protein